MRACPPTPAAWGERVTQTSWAPSSGSAAAAPGLPLPFACRSPCTWVTTEGGTEVGLPARGPRCPLTHLTSP